MRLDGMTAYLHWQRLALLSDLTHQLKTPMANVIMYTELLEDESLKADSPVLWQDRQSSLPPQHLSPRWYWEEGSLLLE